MSKRTVFTTVTPLPSGITRETVMETLHQHTEMIDLNLLVDERHPIKPPQNASPEEYHCLWYSITDRVSYLPGGVVSGKVSYNACFHDLENGLQTHCYAPMGLNIKGKWTLNGSLPGEPIAPVELGLGAPLHGLYLREDVDMKCNIMMTSFVKKTLKKAHASLVARLVVKSAIMDASITNQRLADKTLMPNLSQFSDSKASTAYSPSDYGESPTRIEAPQLPHLQDFESRSSESRDSRETANYEHLYPQALNVRRSGSSYNGSFSSEGRRTSYQELLQGSSNPNPRASHQESLMQDRRVSWQHLNPNPIRSPPLNTQMRYSSSNPSMRQNEPVYQNNNPYQGSGQSYHVELPSEMETPELKIMSRPPGYYTPPTQHGHAELE